MSKLNREDWEEVVETATNQIKTAEKVLELQTHMLNIANNEIAKLPKTKDKDNAKPKLY